MRGYIKYDDATTVKARNLWKRVGWKKSKTTMTHRTRVCTDLHKSFCNCDILTWNDKKLILVALLTALWWGFGSSLCGYKRPTIKKRSGKWGHSTMNPVSTNTKIASWMCGVCKFPNGEWLGWWSSHVLWQMNLFCKCVKGVKWRMQPAAVVWTVI